MTFVDPDMDSAWHRLPEHHQLALTDAALRRCTLILAAQTEGLAEQFETGQLADRGAADALMLLAALLRETTEAVSPVQCHA